MPPDISPNENKNCLQHQKTTVPILLFIELLTSYVVAYSMFFIRRTEDYSVDYQIFAFIVFYPLLKINFYMLRNKILFIISHLEIKAFLIYLVFLGVSSESSPIAFSTKYQYVPRHHQNGHFLLQK